MEVKQIAVIGAGTMGNGIAQVFAHHGYPVVMIDIKDEFVRKGMGAVEKRLYGVASSTLGTMRLTGQMLSLGITMIIFAVFIGRVEVVPEVYPALTGSINIAFIVFSGLCLVGILASLVSSRES